jgi:minor extracellular serine protease Vpr
MQFKTGVFLAIASSLLMSGCIRSSNGLNPLMQLSGNIVSTRSQTSSSHFIAVVKLKNPALLEAPSKVDGKNVVDPDLLAAINKEQDEAIASMKALGDVQIVYRYKMVLNAVAILAAADLEDKIRGIGTIASMENSGTFEMPKTLDESASAAVAPDFLQRNSAKFIGAAQLNARGVTGKGIKVGVIDTGIDYTHAMFKGIGTEEGYKAVNPAEPNAGFPNSRVVGGIDLVGTAYNAASEDFQLHIPKPDMNPIDEAGHGSHVAGTIAGIGDNVNSYNGMAPEASLYAIKVFGAEGSTSDFVVIAALEFAADPNVDGNSDDQLDVVNLSLGSGYGNPHILYAEAIKNLVNGGTVVVASAGNSGHKNYIVGAPSTAEEALSVAASVDNGDHLWKFSASKITAGDFSINVEDIEAATTKKVKDTDVVGKLVYIGKAAVDLTDEQKAAVNGNVAFIDRGTVSFNDKVKRAVAAGAIGVVVANNQPGAALAMGTTDDFAIPAIMITLDDGNKVKAAMANADAIITFKTDIKIEKPELIDTLTDFTSKGPRSIDGWIKPEISAPGSNVISAKRGGGAATVQMSGTSMAGPHVAGVMALLKQAHPDLTALELKDLAMGTSKTIADEKGERYSVSLQGSGRVQAEKAVDSKLLVEQASLSLGELAIESKKVLRRQLTIKNLSTEKQTVQLIFEGNGYITMQAPASVEIEPNASTDIAVNLTLDATAMKDDLIREMDGWVKLTQNSVEVYRVPVLAIAHKLSSLKADELKINSTSEVDSAGASAQLTISSGNANKGQALLFNLIGTDERKPQAAAFQSSDCDLQSAGYRIVNHADDKGVKRDFLQVAVKLYKPMTTWFSCDVSLLIDTNHDGVPEQELLGSTMTSIPGMTSEEFVTTLIDATKARDIRKNYEAAMAAAGGDAKKIAAAKALNDYTESLLEMQKYQVYNNSSVSVLEISTENLALTTDGALSFKLVVTHNEQSPVQFDDYLKSTVAHDMRISLKKEDQAFVDLPESVEFASGASASSQVVQLTKGNGKEKLLVLFPTNLFSLSDLHNDTQSKVLKPSYLKP